MPVGKVASGMPRIVEMIFVSIPAAFGRLAVPCLRSWKRTGEHAGTGGEDLEPGARPLAGNFRAVFAGEDAVLAGAVWSPAAS